MVEALDAGPICIKRAARSDPRIRPYFYSHAWLYLLLARCRVYWTGFASGRTEPEPQDPTEVLYAPKVDKQEALIDWQESALLIERKVRAFNDWPVAYTFLGEHRVRIWEAHCLPGETEGRPGDGAGGPKVD